jgi:hypothetical protein
VVTLPVGLGHIESSKSNATSIAQSHPHLLAFLLTRKISFFVFHLNIHGVVHSLLPRFEIVSDGVLAELDWLACKTRTDTHMPDGCV